MRIKVILVNLIIITLLYNCENKEVTPNKNKWKNELEVELNKNLPGLSEQTKKLCYIDDTLGSYRINIPIPFKFTHRYWEDLLIDTTITIVKNKYLVDSLLNKSDSLIFYFYYDIPAPNTASFFITKQGLKYYGENIFGNHRNFLNYIFTNMTPSDFQAYDYALNSLYEKTNDKKFDISFSNFLEKVSKESYLYNNDLEVFNSLIDWARANPKTEKPDHFIYFLNSFIPIDSIETEIKLPHLVLVCNEDVMKKAFVMLKQKGHNVLP